MIHGLSKNSHTVLTKLSQDIARELNADFVQPDHVLLAIIRHKVGRGYRVLENLHINILSLQVMLEHEASFGIGTRSAKERPISRRLQMVIEGAGIEAEGMHRNAIGTEHLLLGLARDEEGILAKFFLQEGVFLDDARRLAAHMSSSNLNDLNTSTTEKTPLSALEEFGTDLIEKAQKGANDPVIGRDKEIERVIQILSRRTKNNPVLIGEPGVGKTSIVSGLAQRIVNENVPRNLLHAKIISVDLASIIAGTKYRGQFEERLKKIIQEVKKTPEIILFIDELHTIIGTGGTQGAMDAAHILKPVLSTGELRCIGATTFSEYRKYFEKDGALERRFQTVVVSEPSEKDTEIILHGLKKQYQAQHHVEYPDATLRKIVEFSKRYIPNRFFPDKAIDVLDEAGAMKKVALDQRPPEIIEIEKCIEILSDEKEKHIRLQNFEEAGLIRDETSKLNDQLFSLKQNWLSPKTQPLGIVEPEDIARTISVMTDIPVATMTENEVERMLGMEEEITAKLIGQDTAVKTVANALRRARAGIASPERPIGSFLFLGPTGVGKTLLAKQLANFLFGSVDALIRIDMSDYMEKHNAARLVGAPPGYVGFEEGGSLTEKVRQNPYSVILLDEIEKAHKDVYNLLLQVFEEGELKDNLGHTVNFRNTVIIMTGNVGSRSIIEENKLGFSLAKRGVMNYQEIKVNTMNELKEVFAPEFINRIDETVVFTPLNEASIKKILAIEINKLRKRLSAKNIDLKLSNSAEQYCVKKGYDPAYGARPIRRLLQQELEDPLALKIISGEINSGSIAFINCEMDALVIQTETKERTPSFRNDSLINEDTQLLISFGASEEQSE